MLALTHRIVNIGIVIYIVGIGAGVFHLMDQSVIALPTESMTQIKANHQLPNNTSSDTQDITGQQNPTCESEDDDDSARDGAIKYMVVSEASLNQLKLPGTSYLTILQEITTPPPRL